MRQTDILISKKDYMLLKNQQQQLDISSADKMIENVIGVMGMPIGLGLNFLIDNKEYVIPMAVEEPSVVAAATHMAKGTRKTGGIAAESDEPVMIGQIQLVNLEDPFAAKEKILSKKSEIIDLANEQDPILVKFGGGCKNIEVRVLDSQTGPMVITHLLVDCRDAMGANAVNTMAEAVAPRLETITGGRVYLRIISNLAITAPISSSKALIKKIIAVAPKTKKINALIMLCYFLLLQGATDFLNLQFYDVQ